jgi:homoserine kinase
MPRPRQRRWSWPDYRARRACAGLGDTVIWSEHPARVRVPATSANLGPGFDALGLALARHDEVEARVTGQGLSVEVSGEGAQTADAGEGHLVVRAMRAAFEHMGGHPPGLALRCVNAIPHGRGLGSSAAAIVSGLLAARALAGDGESLLAGHDLLRLAAELDGHPDNVAACLSGGLTIAWRGPAAAPRLLRLDVLDGLAAVACVPPFTLATSQARSVLPESVPHADAAANAARSALLVAGLTCDPSVLFDATEDFLHQPYRAAAMPASAGLLRRLRAAGIPAVISGAGPTVLALTVTGRLPGPAVVDSIASVMGNPWDVIPLDIDRQGANVHSGGPAVHPSDSARQGRSWNQAPGPGVPPAGGSPQGRLACSATHGPLSRECRGLLWC